MLKKLLINRYKKKIAKLDPQVNASLNYEMPTPSAKEVYACAKIASTINSFENELKTKDDSFFKEKTNELKALLKEKIKDVEKEEELIIIEDFLDTNLPFYFAIVREAAIRSIKMRHFDSQLIGGIVLHKNKIAEMATGEGKTLVATLAASLNALADRGVHVVTVNDYLAKRDSDWMGPVFKFLGFTIGVIQQDMSKEEKLAAYASDIIYGTNNEFGFDYLRDNMATSCDEMVQRSHFYAIVDEVDSILVDEARTPLIISGPSEVSVEKYYKVEKIVIPQLNVKKVISAHDTKEGPVVVKHLDGSEVKMERDELESKWDAIVEEKTHNAYLTHKGEKACEGILGVKSIAEDTPDEFSNYWSHYVNNSVRAHYLFDVNKDYIVKDGKVIIVDEFTGRLMPGRRWSEGIHQAIEAKEKLRIQQESQTLATVTLQNYFRMYSKLSGMTGTAYTEANEFRHIYKLDVVSLPTNRPLIRESFSDRIYKSKNAKFKAIIAELEKAYKTKQPVLVGTSSIDSSEELSFLLNKKGVPHNVLNAKYHEREAHIVAQAGRLGQVTIATNMAGRGTDIVLGGNLDFFVKEILEQNKLDINDETYESEYKKLYDKHQARFKEDHDKVVELGGLYVIGAQRHEARRIDNQLKGRSGRQGDPGSSRFYIGLDDDLMRLFGSDRIYFIMEKLGFPEDEPIEHALVTRSIEVAQKRVEGHNFEIRKNLIKFDDVMNRQRSTVYDQRSHILESDDIREDILEMLDDVIGKNVPFYHESEDGPGGITHWLKLKFGILLDVKEIEDLSLEETIEIVKQKTRDFYCEKEKNSGESAMRIMEKMVALSIIDSRWKEHLLVIDALKEGVSLRGYAQVDPAVEYQKETYNAFVEMIDSIKDSIVEYIFKAKVTPQKEIETVLSQTPKKFVHSEYSSLQGDKQKEKTNNPQASNLKGIKVGRNDPCPCSSGKKYKKCCGR